MQLTLVYQRPPLTLAIFGGTFSLLAPFSSRHSLRFSFAFGHLPAPTGLDYHLQGSLNVSGSVRVPHNILHHGQERSAGVCGALFTFPAADLVHQSNTRSLCEIGHEKIGDTRHHANSEGSKVIATANILLPGRKEFFWLETGVRVGKEDELWRRRWQVASTALTLV